MVLWRKMKARFIYQVNLLLYSWSLLHRRRIQAKNIRELLFHILINIKQIGTSELVPIFLPTYRILIEKWSFGIAFDIMYFSIPLYTDLKVTCFNARVKNPFPFNSI